MFKLLVVGTGLVVAAFALGFIAWPQLPTDTSATLESAVTVVQDKLQPDTATSSDLVHTTPEPNDPKESIAASSLSFSTAQREMAATLGIDLDSLVITPAMRACATDVLGEEVLFNLMQGEIPSFTQGVALVGCLGKE